MSNVPSKPMESVAANRSIRKPGAPPRPLTVLMPQSLGAFPVQSQASPPTKRLTSDTSFGSFARSCTPAHTNVRVPWSAGLRAGVKVADEQERRLARPLRREQARRHCGIARRSGDGGVVDGDDAKRETLGAHRARSFQQSQAGTARAPILKLAAPERAIEECRLVRCAALRMRERHRCEAVPAAGPPAPGAQACRPPRVDTPGQWRKREQLRARAVLRAE